MLHLILLAVAQSDRLAELIRSSGELRSFTAVYELTTTVEAGKTQIRIDYDAPARVRVDRTLGQATMSTWCVDGVLAVTGNEGGKQIQGRVDSAAVFEEIAPFEKALHDAFPHAPARGAPASAAGMGWGFDSKLQKPNFSIESQLREQFTTPLGWLLTLRQKDASAREDGDVLRFDTDERFHIAISKSNGFLKEFSGPSPTGEIHVALVSLDVNKDVDAARFAIPPATPDALDISTGLARGILRLGELSLRRRIYEAMAQGDTQPPWDDTALAKISSVFRPFYDRTVTKMLTAWFEENRKVQDGVVERLEGLRKAGKSAEEVEQTRQREIGYLTKRLDQQEQEFLTRLALPQGAEDLPRAKELLALEKQILSEVLRAQVREPLLEGFEKASKQ